MKAIIAGLAGATVALGILASPIRISDSSRERAEQGYVYIQTNETRGQYPSISGVELTLCFAATLLSLGGGKAMINTATRAYRAGKKTRRGLRLASLKQLRIRRKSWPQQVQILDPRYHQTARALAGAVWQQYQTDAAAIKEVGGNTVGTITATPADTIVLQLHQGPKGLLILHSTVRGENLDGTQDKVWAMTHISERDFRTAQKAHAWRHITDPNYATAPLQTRARMTKARHARPHQALAHLPAKTAQAIALLLEDKSARKGWQGIGVFEGLTQVLAQARAERRWFKSSRLPTIDRLLAFNATELAAKAPETLGPTDRYIVAKIRGPYVAPPLAVAA